MKLQLETYTVLDEEDGTVTEFTIGSGNVFADMELPDAEELFLKATLGWRVHDEIKKRGWTQAKAARELQICRPDVSLLRNGRFGGFSFDRLFTLLNRLGLSVEVRVSTPVKDGPMLYLATDRPAPVAVNKAALPKPTSARTKKPKQSRLKSSARVKVAA